MAIVPLATDETAEAEALAVFDDIRTKRNTDYVNNFWRALASDPALLKSTWERLQIVMAPGTLDPLVKEMIYLAVSVANNCSYCIHSTYGGSQSQRHEQCTTRRADGCHCNGLPNQCVGHRFAGRRGQAFNIV